MNHAAPQSTVPAPITRGDSLADLTPTRVCPKCPRCRSLVWTVIKVSAALFGRFVGQEISCACLLAILAMEVK